MTLETLVIGAVRIAGSLPVLRWPLAGGILAILIDLSDLLLMNVIEAGGLGDYQAVDKWLDQVYLGAFLVVALGWGGLAGRVAVALYLYRLVGFVVFEVTHERLVFLLFPNLFEVWFLLVAAVRHWRPAFVVRGAHVAAALPVLLVVKEIQEWAIHGAKLFDAITALEAIDLAWRWLTGQGR
jgi:hypothetical protein